MGTSGADFFGARAKSGYRHGNGEDKTFVIADPAGKATGVFHKTVRVAYRCFFVDEVGKSHFKPNASSLQIFLEPGENRGKAGYGKLSEVFIEDCGKSLDTVIPVPFGKTRPHGNGGNCVLQVACFFLYSDWSFKTFQANRLDMHRLARDETEGKWSLSCIF
jgi:hypothetical protein